MLASLRSAGIRWAIPWASRRYSISSSTKYSRDAAGASNGLARIAEVKLQIMAAVAARERNRIVRRLLFACIGILQEHGLHKLVADVGGLFPDFVDGIATVDIHQFPGIGQPALLFSQ